MTNQPPFFDPAVGVFGMALETDGLTVYGAISPVGLLTFGLIWPCDGIWVPCETGISTVWAAGEVPVVTVWTDVTSDSEC